MVFTASKSVQKYRCRIQSASAIPSLSKTGSLSKTDFSGFSAADKVVGRGAAFLYLLLGVKAVYAEVISTPAKELLSAHGVELSYGREAEYIINRKGDGMCPFEAAVLDVSDKTEAYAAIRRKMIEMNIEI